MRVGGFGEPHDRCRCQRLVVTQAKPIVFGVWLGAVGQVGLVAVADKKQIAQHLDRAALLAFAEQRRNRHVEKLTQQIEQRRLHRGDDMDGDALIESLQSAAARIAVGEAAAHGVENLVIAADLVADD